MNFLKRNAKELMPFFTVIGIGVVILVLKIVEKNETLAYVSAMTGGVIIGLIGIALFFGALYFAWLQLIHIRRNKWNVFEHELFIYTIMPPVLLTISIYLMPGAYAVLSELFPASLPHIKYDDYMNNARWILLPHTVVLCLTFFMTILNEFFIKPFKKIIEKEKVLKNKKTSV